MSKIRRKVTVENSKTISDSSTTTSSTSNPAAPSRRPSVFERLGPSTGSNAADVCDHQEEESLLVSPYLCRWRWFFLCASAPRGLQSADIEYVLSFGVNKMLLHCSGGSFVSPGYFVSVSRVIAEIG